MFSILVVIICPYSVADLGFSTSERQIALIVSLRVLIFFFSSGRRHTRWNCDWSSDVCSSDLILAASDRAGLRQKDRGRQARGGDPRSRGGEGVPWAIVSPSRRSTPPMAPCACSKT